MHFSFIIIKNSIFDFIPKNEKQSTNKVPTKYSLVTLNIFKGLQIYTVVNF